MANQQHIDILEQGVDAWNRWREKHPAIRPDLQQADLQKANLIGANFNKTNLFWADLSQANLGEASFVEADLFKAILYNSSLKDSVFEKADLRNADLREADLHNSNPSEANFEGANLYRANIANADLTSADLREADLTEANITGAYLSHADLRGTTFVGADLSGASLVAAILVDTNLKAANLSGCFIYGISAWNVQLEDATQSNLVISFPDEPTLTVDDLEVAQFIYLLLNNRKIRKVIDTITSKFVLILGRFTPKRKAVLDALRDELRKYNYLPVVFDFDKPGSRNLTETVSTLAHLSRFIIADLTDPNSVQQELYAIIPTLAVPVQPLLEASKREYSMFIDLSSRYHWVLPIHRYTELNSLVSTLRGNVIEPAEKKAQELEQR